jgi:predicted site-specific integrase-resolvase
MTKTHSTATAAQAAQVSTATIRSWCRTGVVSATKTAGRWTINASSLNARIQIGLDIETARITRKASTIAALADLSPYKNQKAAAEKVLALLEDGAIVPTSRTGLYQAISSDGTDKYLVDTHEQSCQCRSWLGRQYCTHLTAANAIEASKGNTRPALALVAA